MGLKITTGKLIRPVKTVIYGPEGIGKSTLASKFPDPLFLDTEGGTGQLDVRRCETTSWTGLLEAVKEVAATKPCTTLIIDTADWAEKLCVEDTLVSNGKKSIEAFGYGKGYTYLAENWQRLMAALDGVIEAGIHVAITAHAAMRKQELPDEAGAFDRWELKLTKKVAPIVKEWADLLLFLNYKTIVSETDSGSRKAMGGRRVMYAAHHPCWDAKNRHGLPSEMELDYSLIAHLFKSPQEALAERIAAAEVTEDAFLAVVAEKGQCDAGASIGDLSDFVIKNFCIPHFDKILKIIKEG